MFCFSTLLHNFHFVHMQSARRKRKHILAVSSKVFQRNCGSGATKNRWKNISFSKAECNLSSFSRIKLVHPKFISLFFMITVHVKFWNGFFWLLAYCCWASWCATCLAIYSLFSSMANQKTFPETSYSSFFPYFWWINFLARTGNGKSFYFGGKIYSASIQRPVAIVLISSIKFESLKKASKNMKASFWNNHRVVFKNS